MCTFYSVLSYIVLFFILNQNGELSSRRKMDEEVRDLRTKASSLRQVESDIQARLHEITLLQQTISELRTTVAHQKSHADSLTEDIAQLRATVTTKDQLNAEQAARHHEELQSLKRDNSSLQEVAKTQSVTLTRDFEERIAGLQRDLNEEREGRQRVIDDLDRVRQRHANLEDQMKYVLSCSRAEIRLLRSLQS